MAVFISNLEQLNEHVASGSRAPILLGGDLVFITNEKATIDTLQQNSGEFYVVQPPRIASRGSLLDSKKEHLYLAVSKSAIDYAQSYKGYTLLAADHYLAYGLASKRDCIVIGGGQSDGDFLNLEVFIFTGQRLVETVERSAQGNGYMIETVLRDVIDRYPDHVIYWCEPLGEPPMLDLASPERLEDVGDAPIKSLIKRKLHTRQQRVEESWGVIPALALALAGPIIFGAVAGFQWKQLDSERAEYNQEIAGFEQAYSNSTQSLDLLRHRSYLLDNPDTDQDRVKLLDKLVNASASIPGVVIHSIKVFSETDPDAEQGQLADGMSSARDEFFIDFSVPQDGSSGARDQAEPLVALMNHQTGMTIRVVNHASENIKIGDTERPYWHYKIGGAANAQQ